MKTSLEELNTHLFETIEWLTDRDIRNEELDQEIRRAETVCKVASAIISNAQTVLSAYRTADEVANNLPEWIEGKKIKQQQLTDKTKGQK